MDRRFEEIIMTVRKRPIVIGKKKNQLLFLAVQGNTHTLLTVYGNAVSDPFQLEGKKVMRVIAYGDEIYYVLWGVPYVERMFETIPDIKSYDLINATNELNRSVGETWVEQTSIFADKYEEFVEFFDQEAYIRDWLNEQKIKRLIR